MVSRRSDFFHVFLYEFIKHLFHAFGTWTFNFYLITSLFHVDFPVSRLIRHKTSRQSGRVLITNCFLTNNRDHRVYPEMS